MHFVPFVTRIRFHDFSTDQIGVWMFDWRTVQKTTTTVAVLRRECTVAVHTQNPERDKLSSGTSDRRYLYYAVRNIEYQRLSR